MNKKSLGLIALLFLLPAVALISCGSGDGTYIELPLNPDGSPAVDTDLVGV